MGRASTAETTACRQRILQQQQCLHTLAPSSRCQTLKKVTSCRSMRCRTLVMLSFLCASLLVLLLICSGTCHYTGPEGRLSIVNLHVSVLCLHIADSAFTRPYVSRHALCEQMFVTFMF